jgi:hypothetical protein
MAAKRHEARLYLGREENGRETYEWIGRFATVKERDEAVMRRRIEREGEAAQASRPAGERITCAGFVHQYLARYARERKDSSYDTARSSLARFRADFGERTLASIERHEAIAWAGCVPPSRVPIVVTLFNVAVDEELIDKNPFRGLGHRTRCRRDEHPPTAEEFDRLLAGCAALGDYGPQMAALLIFGACRHAAGRAVRAGVVGHRPEGQPRARPAAAVPGQARHAEVEQGEDDRVAATGA